MGHGKTLRTVKRSCRYSGYVLQKKCTPKDLYIEMS